MQYVRSGSILLGEIKQLIRIGRNFLINAQGVSRSLNRVEYRLQQDTPTLQDRDYARAR